MKKLEIYNLDYDGGVIFVIDGKVDNYIHENDRHYIEEYYESILTKLGIKVKSGPCIEYKDLPKKVKEQVKEFGLEDNDDE